MLEENVSDQSGASLDASDVKPTIGIITALPHEYIAVKVLLNSRRSVFVEGEGAGRQYVYGEIPAADGTVHSVVLAMLPDVGNNMASARATLLKQHFNSIHTVIMTGIAGGVPHPDRPAEHVRLGDVVVSNREGVVQYDFDKEELENGKIKITHRNPPRAPSPTLIESARLLQAGELEGHRPWLRFIDQALQKLSAMRPAEETDTLASSVDPNDTIPHPLDTKRISGQPRVFIGPIASANKLLKNPVRRDQLREKFGVKAVEMEGSGIADAAWLAEIQYAVIRAVCDYCDKNKGDDWQIYAAIVAAAYTRALLEATPGEVLERTPSRSEQSLAREVERQVSDMLTRQAELFAKLTNVEAKVDFNIGPLSVEVPSLPQGVARRVDTVRQFTELLDRATWCALSGSVGSGKTYLAVLIAREVACGVWIRMRNLNSDQACARLDQALRSVSSSESALDWQTLCDKLCARFGTGTLIVIDDLPRISSEDRLASLLTSLSNACAAYGVKLLTTSAYELPIALKTLVGGQIVTVAIPAFTDGEVKELFEVYGLPDEFPFDRYVGFLSALGHRHPTLLAAVARYLHTKGWVITINEAEALLMGRFASDQNVETQMLFVATVQDEQSRNLLYRLNVASRSFTEEDARQIADVEPPISVPVERLNSALGLWVQRDSPETYSLSPLLNQLGGVNLDLATERGVHRVVAETIVSRNRLGGSEVLQVINHFTRAQSYDRAGSILLSALQAMQDEKLTTDVWAISEIWVEVPLPSEMSLNLRLAIRTAQIMTRQQLGKEIEFVLEDLDRLLNKAGDSNAFSVMAATLLVAPVLLQRGDSERARRYLLKAIHAKDHAVLSDGHRFVFPPDVTPESLIWADLGNIKSEAELRQWWETFEQFTPEQVQVASQGLIAEYGCMVIADRLVELEAQKLPPAEPDWDTVLVSLEEFSARAQRLGFELLWACIVSARINVLGKFKNELDRALQVAREALTLASEDPRVNFVIRESTGERLVRAGREKEGVEWLKEALASPTEAFAVQRMYALLVASEATAITDPNEALQLTKQAVELAKAKEEIPGTDVVKALGEQAIATWLVDNLRETLLLLVEASERLFATKTNKPTWKVLFVTYGHVVGYLSYLSKFGEPPRMGGITMPAPVRNVFLFDQPDALAQYDESKDCLVINSLASFAVSVGEQELGSQLALRAFDMASEIGSVQTRAVVAPFVLPYLVCVDRYEDAINAALLMGNSIVAAEVAENSGEVSGTPTFDFEAAFGAKPSESWTKSETKAAFHGLVPIMFRLGMLRQTDDARASASAQRVARACREKATNASSSQLWNDAADLFESIFAGTTSAEELRRRGNDHAQDSPPVFHTLCFIGISLLGTVDQAIRSQLAVLPYLTEVFGVSSPMYTQIISPFIQAYWFQTIEESPFSFSNPTAVRESFARISEEEFHHVSAPKILEVLTVNLGIVPSEKAKTWLRTPP